MSFKIVEMGVVAPKWFVMEVLRDKATVLSLVPRGLVRPLDPSYDRVEVRFRWALFSLRGVYRVRVEEVDDRTILYILESGAGRIVVRFMVIEGGVTVSKFYAGLESEGVAAVSRVAPGLRPRLVEWMEALRDYLETEARRRGVIEAALKARPGPPAEEEAPAAPRPVQASTPSQPQPLLEGLEEGSERLADPLFDAETLIRGRIVLVDTILLARIADVVDRLSLEGRLDRAKTYVAKISLGDAEASLLIENARLAGAIYREQGRTHKALEALEKLQKRLPAQAHITVIEL